MVRGEIKRAVLAAAVDYVTAPRSEERELSPEKVKQNRFDRLKEFVDKFDGENALDAELFSDLVVQVAIAMGITSSRADLEKLANLVRSHVGEPIIEWIEEQRSNLNKVQV